MLKRILLFYTPICMFMALFLKLNGVDKIEFTDQYYRFVRGVALRAANLNFKIPNIPLIPELNSGSGWWDILGFLINFANSIVKTFNIIIMVLNMLVSMLIFFIFMIIEGVNSIREIFLPSNVVAFALSC